MYSVLFGKWCQNLNVHKVSVCKLKFYKSKFKMVKQFKMSVIGFLILLMFLRLVLHLLGIVYK